MSPTTPGPAGTPPRTSRTDERLAALTLAIGALAGVTSLLPVVPLALAAVAVTLALTLAARKGSPGARRTALTGMWVGIAGAVVNLLLVVLPRLAS